MLVCKLAGRYDRRLGATTGHAPPDRQKAVAAESQGCGRVAHEMMTSRGGTLGLPSPRRAGK
jgi:hypothetical protein